MPDEILMLGPVGPVERALEPQFTIHRIWKQPDPDRFLMEVGPRIRAAVAYSGALPADSALMDALPNLAIIAVTGAGYESVEIEAAKARGIIVTNAGSVNASDVAEHAFALILDVARGISAGDRHVRAGRWASEGWMKMTARLGGRRLGILGLGNIGLALATRAAAFDMPVAYHSRKIRPDVPYEFVGSLTELARDVDVLAVCTPGGPETHHLIDRAILDALGPKGILVNIARGSVVDEAALVGALAEGRLGGAGLDVFESEPNIPAALLDLPNVVLTPHRGGATYEAVQGMVDVVTGNLRAYFAGDPVINRVA